MANHNKSTIPPIEDLKGNKANTDDKPGADEQDQSKVSQIGFEIPGGEYKPGEEFTLGKQMAGEAVSPAGSPYPYPMAAVYGAIADAISELRAELILEIERARNQIQAQLAGEEGMEAVLVGGQFNCPDCGNRLDNPGMGGMKSGLYEHNYQSSVQLSGVQCKRIGQKFRPPVVFLRLAPPKAAAKPLTTDKPE
jgi:hypothetical protein